MSKHTPGPWVLDNAEGGDWFRYVLAEDSQIGRVDLGNRGAISQHGEANARLIASAPEIYAALKDLVYQVQGPDQPAWLCLKDARAAIAKAEGK